MLAGTVSARFVGQSLILAGDGRANGVVIDLAADSIRDAIQGQDTTQVRFIGRAKSGDVSQIRHLRAMLRGGDDQLVVRGAGDFDGNVTVWLGTGDDTLSIVDSARVGNDLRVRGQAGDDLIFLDQVEIGDDLFVQGGPGDDTVVANETSVQNRSLLAGYTGNDTISVVNATASDDALIFGGPGDDHVGLSNSNFDDGVRVAGMSGRDTLSDEEAVASRAFSVDTLDDQEAESTNQAAMQPVKDWLFQTTTVVDRNTADTLHDAVADLVSNVGDELVALDLDPESQTVSVVDPTPGVSVVWDQVVQQAVANTSPGPTIASRAYAMMHTAMYDAWSAYDDSARSTQREDELQRPATENTDDNKIEAMSFAAYRVLDDLFADQTQLFDSAMESFDYDPSDRSTDVSTPSGIGNAMAAAVLEFRHADGSNQLDPVTPYADTSGYTPVNGPGQTDVIEAWTPEFVPVDVPADEVSRIQEFLTPHWGEVIPFGIESGSSIRPEAPEPFLLVDGPYDAEAKTIVLDDGSEVPIDQSLIGTLINPEFIAQAEEVVDFSANLTDEQKLIAEFWEDAGGTAFPPGTFMTFAQYVSARDNNSVDEDAALFLAISNSIFDAGIATWDAKVHYDYPRPFRAVRELGELGLIGEFDPDLDGFAIDAWQPDQGTQRILASEFLTYQTPGSDPSPPFAEYTSGHSGFSAAGAEILALFTGSDDFGGSVVFPEGSSRFEPGLTPAADTTLSWATFTDAADEAGISRLYGGIHFADGDLNGRKLGREAATAVWARVQDLLGGSE